jgi:O-antigen chain-terminating methyltransferase
MPESNDNEINVAQLMQHLRGEAAQLKAEEHRAANIEASASRFVIAGQTLPQINLPALNLQPEFHTRADNRYHVNELLKYHDRDFVRNAYRAILLREPDAAGLDHYLESLRRGQAEKIDVLESLRDSTEGQRNSVQVDGLAWLLMMRKLTRVPGVGYIVEFVIALAGLPVLVRNQRQSEAFAQVRQQEIVEAINEANLQLTGYANETNATLKRLMIAAADIFEDQRNIRKEIYTRLDADQDRINRQLDELIRQVRDEIQSHFVNVQKQSATLAAQFGERATRGEAVMARLVEQLETLAKEMTTKQQQTRAALTIQESRVARLLEETTARLPAPLDQEQLRVYADEHQHLRDARYVSFEDHFRGTREVIKERLRVYLPILKDARITRDILDIGCGRGEWLQLIKDEGWQGRGVDTNRLMVEQGRANGLEMIEEDVIAYLRGLPDASLSAITSFHMIEHLPFETLNKFLDEIVRTLKPEGVVILETPNPENVLVGSCQFYLDPTHRNPLPYQTMQYLFESRGLARVEVMKLHPWESAQLKGDSELIALINKYFYGPFDYGIIGWKT